MPVAEPPAERAGASPCRLLILGSTGSIGRQTLDVVAGHRDRFEVVGLVAGQDVAGLVRQGREWNVPCLGVGAEAAGDELRMAASGARLAVGLAAVCELVEELRPDLVVAAVSGVAGLYPLMTALNLGLDVAVANKEPLVAAGELVMEAAGRHGARLRPIDSEISAVFQCLEGRPREHLHRVLLTASGGAFRDLDREQLAAVTPEMALAHPTWRMGRKITVDCATLANKGFEVFELKWLFGLDFAQIKVLLHHQSIIHSMVELLDGSVIAQLGPADMRYAIQYALSWPERLPNEFPRLDLAQVGALTFGEPDTGRFPMLRLAYAAGESGASYPAALNAANEQAVAHFLEGRTSFVGIAQLVERALEAHEPVALKSLDDVAAVDGWARRRVDSDLGRVQ
jgi:1-deoxy-D-xylulose-5-phosphate reductoisomerase